MAFADEPQENMQDPHEQSCKVCGRICTPDPELAPLCENCRTKFINYPIPKKIWFPALLVLILVLVVAFVRLPGLIKTRLHYERGLQAIAQKNYVTAEKHLREVNIAFPNSPEVVSNLAISLYANNKYEDAMKLIDFIIDKKMEFKDHSLYQKVQGIVDEVDLLYATPDEFTSQYQEITALSADEQIKRLETFEAQFPDYLYIKYMLADLLFDEKQFDRCEKLVQEIHDQIPDNVVTQIFMVAIYREKGDFEKAESIALNALENNHESAYILNTLARLELKRMNDTKALEYVNRAAQYAPDEFDTLLEQARVYYYNHMETELKEVLEKINAHADKETYQEEITKVMDIIEGKTQWR